jgi:hypothetical protein
MANINSVGFEALPENSKHFKSNITVFRDVALCKWSTIMARAVNVVFCDAGKLLN